jgi:ligand-binding sensor domain-containing protein
VRDVIRNIALITSLIVLWTGPAETFSLSEQAVTIADHSFIRDITSSLQRVYFATTNGIIRYNKQIERWEAPITVPPDIGTVERIWVDTFDERLYVRTPVGYHEYHIGFDTWYPLAEAPTIRSDNRRVPVPEHMLPPFGHNYSPEGSLIDANGRAFSVGNVIDEGIGTLWLGTWGYGPGRASATSGQIELLPFGLLQNRVDAIYHEDSLLWLGGNVGPEPRTGITIFDTERYAFDYIEGGLSTRLPIVDINCLAGDARHVFVGTALGLYRIRRDSRQVTRHLDTRHGMRADEITSLLLTGDSLFVGTINGINLLTREGDSVRLVAPEQFNNRIIYDFERVDDDLWIAAENGAYRLRLTSGKLQRFTDPSNVIFGSVYAIRRNGDDIWLASDDGVVRVNMNTAEVTPFSEIQRLRGYRALAVNDEIAVVSSDHGMQIVFYTRKNPYIREFTVQDGLASDRVLALEMDGNYVWVGTDKGLTKFLWKNPRRVD